MLAMKVNCVRHPSSPGRGPYSLPLAQGYTESFRMWCGRVITCDPITHLFPEQFFNDLEGIVRMNPYDQARGLRACSKCVDAAIAEIRKGPGE